MTGGGNSNMQDWDAYPPGTYAPPAPPLPTRYAPPPAYAPPPRYGMPHASPPPPPRRTDRVRAAPGLRAAPRVRHASGLRAPARLRPALRRCAARRVGRDAPGVAVRAAPPGGRHGRGRAGLRHRRAHGRRVTHPPSGGGPPGRPPPPPPGAPWAPPP